MKWDKIIGNEKVKDFFKKLLQAEQKPHAFLFVGSNGIGKALLAKTFAAALLCGNGKEACGNCDNCHHFKNKSHPDYFYIEPDLKKDSEERKDNISINQIREVLKEAAYTSKLSSHKVVIVDGMELLQAPAANSILKLLEEPPVGWVFLLIADSVENILPTILSRTTKIKVNTLTNEEMIRYLEKYNDIDKNVIASLACGSIGKADSYINDEIKTIRKSTLLFLKAAFLGDYILVSPLIEKIEKNHALNMLEFISTIVRDAWHLRYLRDENVLNIDMKAEITEVFTQKHLSLKDFKFMMLSVDKAYDAIKRSANIRLALEGLFIELTAFNYEN